ncbi:MAG: PEP-CTERM sorting domain-containing protein [Verrucomicrobiota bacterium]
MKKTLRALALCFALGLSLATAPAQVVVETANLSLGVRSLANNTTVTENYSFTTNSASDSVLFVGVASEDIFVINGVSYNGTSAQVLADTTFGTNQAAVFIVNLGNEVGTTADIGVQITTQDGDEPQIAATAVQVSNALFNDSLGDFQSYLLTNGTVDFGGTDFPQGSFYFDMNVDLFDDAVATGLTRTAEGPAQNLPTSDATSSYVTNVSGVISPGWQGQGGAFAAGIIEAASIIPEPSSAALLGLGGLLLLRRRRA